MRLGTRNIQTALRKLRRFARQGAERELDLGGTISSTARNGAWPDIRMGPERHNAVKVLLFLDKGGSMYPYVRTCEELFPAAHSEFEHLEYFYFHNFIYDYVWKDNQRGDGEKAPMLDALRTCDRDCNVIIAGDASMSPYEITMPGGSVEYWSEETGRVGGQRLLSVCPRAVWLKPVREKNWSHIRSVAILRGIMEDKMFPLTVEGLERSIEILKGPPVVRH